MHFKEDNPTPDVKDVNYFFVSLLLISTVYGINMKCKFMRNNIIVSFIFTGTLTCMIYNLSLIMISIKSDPLFLTWQDSKKMNAVDSIKEIGFIEGALSNFPFICIPCDPDSPYMKFLPKQGYEQYFKPINLFIKTR